MHPMVMDKTQLDGQKYEMEIRVISPVSYSTHCHGLPRDQQVTTHLFP